MYISYFHCSNYGCNFANKAKTNCAQVWSTNYFTGLFTFLKWPLPIWLMQTGKWNRMIPGWLRFMLVLLWPWAAENMAYTNYRHTSCTVHILLFLVYRHAKMSALIGSWRSTFYRAHLFCSRHSAYNMSEYYKTVLK